MRNCFCFKTDIQTASQSFLHQTICVTDCTQVRGARQLTDIKLLTTGNVKGGYTLVTLPRINTVSWQCERDSCPRNVSKVGYAVTLRAFFSVCCRYLAVASKGWYGYGLSRCGRATWLQVCTHPKIAAFWRVTPCRWARSSIGRLGVIRQKNRTCSSSSDRTSHVRSSACLIHLQTCSVNFMAVWCGLTFMYTGTV